jgi:broad specificity polyphosphatase/5'/3'-nucleotidase SurE
VSDRTLPIIGTIRSTTGQSWTAIEPITAEELTAVIRSTWCRSVRATDGPTSPADCVTYYALVEIEGDVLVVTGIAKGER